MVLGGQITVLEIHFNSTGKVSPICFFISLASRRFFETQVLQSKFRDLALKSVESPWDDWRSWVEVRGREAFASSETKSLPPSFGYWGDKVLEDEVLIMH